jgi:hypothetical protein
MDLCINFTDFNHSKHSFANLGLVFVQIVQPRTHKKVNAMLKILLRKIYLPTKLADILNAGLSF